MKSETVELLEKMSGSVNEFVKGRGAQIDTLEERVERIEAHGERPHQGADKNFSREDNEHKSVFLEWVRNPRDAVRVNRLSEAQHEIAKKDVSIGANAAGGFALPKEISSKIETRVRQLNPFRSLVRVDQCNSNDYHALVSMGDGTSGWSTETGTRSATTSTTLRDRAPTFGELYAYPTASNWSLQDIFFDVQNWLVNDIAADFSSAEATAIVSGSGTARPTGILNTTPTAVGDDASPMRAATTIEFTSLVGFSPTSPVSINIDALINLVSKVKEKYLMESDRIAFCMHRTTLSALRRLKASTAGSYLLEPSVQAGMPASLLGYPVVTCDAMPTIANDNFCVLFGNWARGYLLVDRIGMSIVVDQVTVPGLTKFYVSRRVGGCVLVNDALKVLRIAD
jgi:HK97 family phage major capsid protein